MAHKWIINDGKFKISRNIESHFELVKAGAETKGGGIWHVPMQDTELEEKKVYLYGSSFDYGSAKKEDVIKAMEDTMISTYFSGFTFYFSNDIHLSEAMKNAEEIYKCP